MRLLIIEYLHDCEESIQNEMFVFILHKITNYINIRVSGFASSTYYEIIHAKYHFLVKYAALSSDTYPSLGTGRS